jgi:hypothetical protein
MKDFNQHGKEYLDLVNEYINEIKNNINYCHVVIKHWIYISIPGAFLAV